MTGLIIMATLPADVTLCPVASRRVSKIIDSIGYYQVGAGGGTRTHTTFYSPRILSPVRLPFRHTGKV